MGGGASEGGVVEEQHMCVGVGLTDCLVCLFELPSTFGEQKGNNKRC